jgi:hypothetical protein
MSSTSSCLPPKTRTPVQFAVGRQQLEWNIQHTHKYPGQTVKWDRKRSTHSMSRITTSGPRPGPTRSGAHTPSQRSRKLTTLALAALTHRKGGQP